MKNRKWLALGLAACMTMSVLSACGQAEQKEESSANKEESSVQESKSEEVSEEVVEDTGITFPLKETITFTGFTDREPGGPSINDVPAWQEFEAYGNIDVEWTEASRVEASEKGSLLLAGGTYPDFFFRNTPNIQKYGVEEGIYIPLEDLIRENMPNLTAILDNENGWARLESSDGHVYSIGIILDTNVSDWPFWINRGWLDRLGLDMPTSMEDLYEISKAFKEQDANGNGDPNDEIPVTFSSQAYNIKSSMYYLDDGTVYHGNYCYIKDGVKSFYPFTDGFKENYLRWWKRMWDEELMDHNSFTQTDDQMAATLKAGDVLGWYVAHNPGIVAETVKDDFVAIMPEDKEYPVYSIPRILGGGGLAITDKCENPEVLLAWYDYFYSEEGGYLAYYGIEGVDYVKNENGSVSPIGERAIGLNTGSSMTWLEPKAVNIVSPELVDKFQDHMITGRKTLATEYAVVVQGPVLTEEETEIISTYQPDLFSYIDTYVAEVITGVKDLDATWDEFQSTMRAMGAEEVEAVYQAEYARATGK